MPELTLEAMLPNFHGEEIPADEAIQDLVDSIKEEVNFNVDKEYEYLKAVSYKRETVDGSNFLVKVIGDNDAVHESFSIIIHKPCPHTGKELKLIGVKLNKTIQEMSSHVY